MFKYFMVEVFWPLMLGILSICAVIIAIMAIYVFIEERFRGKK